MDPCAELLTEKQLRDLHYDLGYARPPIAGRDDIHGGPACTYASSGGAGGVNRHISTLITISTTEGASTWATDPTRKASRDTKVVGIAEFYALMLPHPKQLNDCLVVVDTADSQYLDVSSGLNSGPAAPMDTYCQEAERVAGMAIQTLTAGR